MKWYIACADDSFATGGSTPKASQVRKRTFFGCPPNAKLPALGGHPKNVLFLTCDAFGVLPPVAKLSSAQAMYHFISGYTAKVAGTKEGVTEPEATFSACFGQSFLVLHPYRYAKML